MLKAKNIIFQSWTFMPDQDGIPCVGCFFQASLCDFFQASMLGSELFLNPYNKNYQIGDSDPKMNNFLSLLAVSKAPQSDPQEKTSEFLEARKQQKKQQSETTSDTSPNDEKPKALFFVNELLKFATEIKKDDCIKKQQKKEDQPHQELPWPREKEKEITQGFYNLFDLYIKQEILKHYCAKLNWKFQERLIKTFVTPYLQFLAVNEKQREHMFEPFLREMTSVYLLHTPLDLYSRLEPTDLICEMSKAWIQIRKAQMRLRSLLKVHVKEVSLYFSLPGLNKNPQAGLKLPNMMETGEKNRTFNRIKLFKYLFSNKKDKKSTVGKMTNLIKVFIFCNRVFGDDMVGDIGDWINQA